MDQVNNDVNQGDPQEKMAGDAALDFLERTFYAVGGSGAVWNAISGSAALRCIRSGADRLSFWQKFDRDLVGGRWSSAPPSLRGAWTDPLRGETVPEATRLADRRLGVPGPAPAVRWAAATWANCKLGLEGIKWEAAAAAQRASFDAGFHRATGEDKSGLVRWAYEYTCSVPTLYASWLWELYIDLAGRGGAWVEGLGSVPLERPPQGPARAMWLAENPGGLAFPPSGVIWGGDPVGWGARRPFLRRAEGAEGGERIPDYDGRRLFFVTRDHIPAASSSPLLSALGPGGADAGTGFEGRPDVYVSRAKTGAGIWEDVVRVAAAAGREGVLSRSSRSLVMMLPWISADELTVLAGGVFLSWRIGMGIPLREFGSHVQSVGRGGTRDLPPLPCPHTDWSGALRLLANARFRIGDSTIWEAPGCSSELVCFRGDWESRIALETGILSIPGASVIGPVGEELEHAVAALGYELARWVDRSVQRTVGHGDNAGLARRGSAAYTGLVQLATMLPAFHSVGDAVAIVPVLGFSTPIPRRLPEPPDRWKFGRRATWSRSLVGVHTDAWSDVTGGVAPRGRGGLGATSVHGPVGQAATYILSRSSGGISLSGVWGASMGHPDELVTWEIDQVDEPHPEAVPAPEEMMANEFVSLSVVGSTLRGLSEITFLSPDKAVQPAIELDGLSF